MAAWQMAAVWQRKSKGENGKMKADMAAKIRKNAAASALTPFLAHAFCCLRPRVPATCCAFFHVNGASKIVLTLPVNGRIAHGS